MSASFAPIGFVGLGNMGYPMVQQLLRGGAPVFGYDTLAENLDRAAAAGLQPTASLADLARATDAIVLMLPNSSIVEAVTDELLAAYGRTFTTIIDMSSSEPGRTKQLAEKLAGEGIALVDAPVSGGVLRASDGSLTIMVGGEPSAAERVRPVLELLGSTVTYAGPAGAGHAVKALNNLLSATHLLASNTAALAAAQIGVDPEVFVNIINESSGRSGSTQLKLPRFVLTGAFDSGFSADLLQKDLGIALSLLESLGLESPVTAAARDEWTELNARLERGADHTAIIQPLEADAGRALRA